MQRHPFPGSTLHSIQSKWNLYAIHWSCLCSWIMAWTCTLCFLHARKNWCPARIVFSANRYSSIGTMPGTTTGLASPYMTPSGHGRRKRGRPSCMAWMTQALQIFATCAKYILEHLISWKSVFVMHVVCYQLLMMWMNFFVSKSAPDWLTPLWQRKK